MNILDMPEDVLSKIGIQVKQDNITRMEKKELFRYMDEGLEELKSINRYNREEIGDMIYDRLYKVCCSDEDIKEYKNTRNVNYVYIYDNDSDFEDFDIDDYYEYRTDYYNQLKDFEDNILCFSKT